jgi:hypothetical protein
MDDLSIRKLTTEILEAVIDKDWHVPGMSHEEMLASDFWAEAEIFDGIAMNSERLRETLGGTFWMVYDDMAESEGSAQQISCRLPEMTLSKELMDTRVAKILAVCRNFFLLGWHARGAAEEAEQLKRMTE